MTDLKHILETAQTIAVVGCSHQPSRTSFAIAKYLQEVGYRIVPVNPYREEILGEPCYPDLQHIPDDVHVDVVNVFRRPQFTAGVVDDALARAERTGEQPVIWTQLGVSSPEAAARAAEGGLPYVAERCIRVDHARLAR